MSTNRPHQHIVCKIKLFTSIILTETPTKKPAIFARFCQNRQNPAEGRSCKRTIHLEVMANLNSLVPLAFTVASSVVFGPQYLSGVVFFLVGVPGYFSEGGSST